MYKHLQHLSGDHLRKLKDFWIHQLTGLQPLELLTDHPRPPTPSYTGASVAFQIEPHLLALFVDLCQSENATLQMGLLALMALLLHRYSRQDDFAIGIPIRGHNHPDLENLTGLFINTLPIRIHFEQQLSFRQLLAQIKATSLAAYNHQELPFEQMVEALQPGCDAARKPLVQVMLQLDELEHPSLQSLCDLEVEALDARNSAARLDVEIFLQRSKNGGINGRVVYATDLFNVDRIERLTTHLHSLLGAILEIPDAPVDSLSFLTSSEQLLIESWQHGPTINLPGLCAHQLFEQQAVRTPHSLALVFEDQQLTYAELNSRANQLAHHLIDLGIGNEKIVGVCLERSVELVVSLLAVLKAGGAYLPLDPAWPEVHLQALLKASGAYVVIFDPSTAPAFTNAPVSLRTVNLYDLAKSAKCIAINPQETSPDSLAYLLFTSGSTGSPKGVLIEHRALAHRVIGLQSFLPLHTSFRVLALTASVFDISLLELVVPLTCGGLIVLANEQQRRDPASLEKLLTHHKIALLQATPSMLFNLVDSAGLANSDLTILSGGEELPLPLANKLSKMCGCLLNGYGPTEATIYTSLAKVDVGNSISIGHPIAGTTVRILSSTGQHCPIGIPGELHIGGVGLARGYLNNPELTSETFIPDPFSSDPTARLYKSGDLASWNPDGTIAFHGRIDQQIKLRGYRIEPGEIETHLLAYPAIAQAAVVLNSTDLANPRLIAYWVAQATDGSSFTTPSAVQLRSFLADRLPSYMVPSAFVALDALPLTTNGKLDRKALPAPSFSADPQQRIPPNTDLERKLHAIWAEVLGHADFGITDSFLELGGNSLDAALIITRMQSFAEKSLYFSTFFQYQTISDLCRYLRDDKSSDINALSTSNLVLLQRQGSKPPIFIIHGFGGQVDWHLSLAREFSPDQPVYGIVATNNPDANIDNMLTIDDMAIRYAKVIRSVQPNGPYNVIGYSAGGWYAYAVANALLSEGETMGYVGILDTHATAKIHRRLLIPLVIIHLLLRLPKGLIKSVRRGFPNLNDLSALQSTSRTLLQTASQIMGYKRSRSEAYGGMGIFLGILKKNLILLAGYYLHVMRPYSLDQLKAKINSPGATGELYSNDFYAFIHSFYRPPRLAINVHLYTTPDHSNQLKHLWGFYATRGVETREMFHHHFDFSEPRLASALASVIRADLHHEKIAVTRDHQLATKIPHAKPIRGNWPVDLEAFPSSYSQSRLWFLHQLQPGFTVYHMPTLWLLSGEFDLNALRLALGDLIKRHPTLRTSFRLYDNEVLQIIHPPAPFPLEAEPLGDLNPDTVVEQWLDYERSTPFDLSTGLLLRARLLDVDEQHHLLLINHHHIASDGWSLSILIRDLTKLYNAQVAGRSPQLEPLCIHYSDYAAWQRQRLSGTRLQDLNDYWIGQLRNLEPLELPTDHPRPAMPSHRGRSVEFTIEPQLLEPFEELCRREGATLQMGLLAVVALLLHRTSRQDDVAIGVPFWGRNHPELENLIGFFINTLPIRTRFQANQTFRDLLRQVKETSIAAYDHQELPFEQMVKALNVERDTSRNPLVQVMLQLMELPEATLEQLDGLAVQSLPTGSDSAKLDLSFYLYRSADQGLSASITYATDLFDSDRIERLTGHLRTLLGSALEAPDAAVDALNLLPEAERQLIESWQQGPVVEVPELCVHELFEQQVQRTPEAIALVFEDQEITYSELNARANQLAHHLRDHGVGPDVIVGVCLERSVELIISLLAILKVSGAYLPLDPAWPEERQHLLLEEAGCTLLLTAEGPEVIHSPHPVRGAVSGPPLAYVTYTSGSTGIPKGVAVGHPSILRLVNPVNGYQLSVGHRVLQLAPMAFDASTLEIWGPLLNGGTLVIAPPGQLSLQELAEVLRQGRITTLWLTAGLFHAMVESELEALAGVRQVLAGGDVLAPEHVQRLLDAFPAGHMLINGYGPTENTTFTCCHRLPAGAMVGAAGVPLGRPIATTTVQVLDGQGNPCQIGIPGELHIGGAGLARGYLNNPVLTAEKFIPDPFSSDPTARLYKSGDLASWNADGTLAFHGRIDEQIKLRGFRIEPGEIEVALIAHPAIEQAVVLLRQDQSSNPQLVAYWIAAHPSSDSTGSVFSSAELRTFLARNLPDYMLPAAFVRLEALPLTPNGKLDRRALPAPSFSGDLQQRVEPSTELELQLHALWAEVLGHSDFGIHDNFFAVGGHSLSALRLAAGIEQRLDTTLSISTLFKVQTIADLGLFLESKAPAEWPYQSLVPLQPLGELPALFAIHGLGGSLFSHLNLANELAPDRPFYGLQAVGLDDPDKRHVSMEDMIAHYAKEIRSFQPHGPYNLIGYSAGGLYAYAVAEKLVEQGAPIGFLGLIDTFPPLISTKDRIQADLYAFVKRIPVHIWRLASSNPVTYLSYLGSKRNSFKYLLMKLGLISNTSAGNILEGVTGDYFGRLSFLYRPRRLPLSVHVFTTHFSNKHLQRLWSFYALKGASMHPLLDHHHEYTKSTKLHPALANLLREILCDIESNFMG